MTTELEKQFFSVFGIKSKMGCTAYEELEEAKADLICNDYCPECDYFKEVYPQITDRHYLELFVTIINKWGYFTDAKHKTEINEFKEQLLKDVMFLQTEKVITPEEVLKHQVQAIFEGEDNV